MQGLLNADGHGVSMESVAGAIMPLQDVIHAMSIPTSVLCNAMDAVLTSNRTEHGVIPKSCMQARTLMCIISHRKDRAASKFLKERMKMPKLDGKRRGLFF
ncbi:MAG: hypothetical protein HC767_01965 [Akkermansiaceae bacterium]|nr:hypothetical protein [Akkermansiaceae bacterium]